MFIARLSLSKHARAERVCLHLFFSSIQMFTNDFQPLTRINRGGLECDIAVFRTFCMAFFMLFLAFLGLLKSFDHGFDLKLGN